MDTEELIQVLTDMSLDESYYVLREAGRRRRARTAALFHRGQLVEWTSQLPDMLGEIRVGSIFQINQKSITVILSESGERVRVGLSLLRPKS